MSGFLISRSEQEAMQLWGEPGPTALDVFMATGRLERSTQPLAAALCEQLRTILEPTLKGRLQGYFRTGKRISMRRVIPFIASNYRRDKIWLRRTKPSKREYQIVVAIDNSRSMKEQGVGPMALQTLCVLCQALAQLEVGEYAVLAFGSATPRVLLPLGSGQPHANSFNWSQAGPLLRECSLALTLVHPGQLELRAVWQDERLQPGEFLVEVEYSSVQPMDGDMFHCCGAFSDLALPHVMGVEGVGVVLKSENQRLKEGARIGFLLRKFFNDEHHGCWQKRLVLDERRALVLGVPPVVGLNQVAACLSSSVAALAFLKPFAPQSQIIVTGACGAVGLAVLQLGALRGHRMLAFVRGPERAAWLAGAGLAGLPSAELAVVDTNSDWVRLAAPMCGKGELMSPESQDVCGGADGIIDAVGGEVLALAAEHLLRVRATVVSFGNAACESNERLAAAQRRLRLQVRRESVESFMATPDAAEQVQKAFELIGVYQAKAWHVASWREAQECMKEQPTWTRHQTQVKPGRIGRILLKFD
ncbi:unnamed protein product [Effrenium voratum]|nr:unnamed protein product [Effrenium voratum]